MRDEVTANLHLWEGWAEIHLGGDFYDVEGFIEHPEMRPFDRVTRGVVGDVSGARVLHLQCHVGIDTLRFLLMGSREVVGVDFSPRALEGARMIAERMGFSDRARFVQSDVTALPDSVEPDSFDIVFSSYGAIEWLPDLEPWADMIASRLAPGGVFHLIDSHPFAAIFDDEDPDRRLTVKYRYFGGKANHWPVQGSYADPDADFTADSYFWIHPLSEIVSVLAARGLVIESLREYPLVAWQALDFMVEAGEGLWELPPEIGDIPLMFSVSARKPADGADGLGAH